MKILLRVLAMFLLILLALVTFARRESSGAWIAYTSQRDGFPAIFLMTGDGASKMDITPPDTCASLPQWSPDARWIAYTNSCGVVPEIWRMRVGGKTTQFVSEGFYALWSPDAQRMLVSWGEMNISIIDPDGSGDVRTYSSYLSPTWSPDGQWIYVTGNTSVDRIHTETGQIEKVMENSPPTNSFPDWSPDGSQLTLRQVTVVGDTLIHIAPDGSNLREIPLDVPAHFIYQQKWSPNGEWIAFLAGIEDPYPHQIYRVRPDGSESQLVVGQTGNLAQLQWSPDGDWLLFQEWHAGGVDILRARPDGSQIENLTPGPGESSLAQYAPVSGMAWHPLWVMIVAVGIILATWASFFLPSLLISPRQQLTGGH